MTTHLDCVPCILRQTLDAIRLITTDQSIHEQVVRESLLMIDQMGFDLAPPVLIKTIHNKIKALTGEQDPYGDIKKRSNWLGQRLYPWMASYVTNSDHPRDSAMRLAMAGNVIDLSIKNKVDESDVRHAIELALKRSYQCDGEEFFQAIDKANHILYLADNAGEIVFDKLLLKQMPLEKMTVVVKGYPIINDATMEDARQVGLNEIVTVIDNGSDVPGTLLEECSPAFLEKFNQADLIISKGQGNYETLNEVDKDIFFMLKANCSVIANQFNSTIGELILKRSSFVKSVSNGTPCIVKAR